MLEELEKIAISLALRRAKGNQEEAAKILGICPRTIRYKIEKYPELLADCSEQTIINRLCKKNRDRLRKLFPDY